MNRFGKRAAVAFIALLFTGYLLIFQPPIEVTVSHEAVYAFGAVLSGAAFRTFRSRRDRR